VLTTAPTAVAASPSRRFLLLAFTVGWAPWLAGAAGAGAWHHTIANLLLLGAPLVLAASVLLLVRAAGDRAAAREYLRSIVDPGRAGFGLLAAALLAMPALAAAAAVLGAWSGGMPLPGGGLLSPALPAAGAAATLKTLGLAIVLGPLLEEMAWRGYALPRLQERHGALPGALLAAGAHAAWHLPLFFLPGTAQHELGLLTPQFWRFLVDIVALGLIAAAFYGTNRRSTLAAILLHAGYNSAGVLLLLSEAAMWWRTGADLVLALLAVMVIRRRPPGAALHLRRRVEERS